MQELQHWRTEDSKRNTQATVRIAAAGAAAAVAAGLESRTPAGPTGSEQVCHSTGLAATECPQEDRRDADRDIEPFD